MTNYRHGQMINLIDEMNSPLLAVEPQRCVLVRHRNGECLRCAAVCTTGAISLGEEGIVVSPEKCIGCGTCASACPTGCLTAANPTDEELFGAVEAALAAGGGRVAIACERAFAMASGNRMKRDSCDATAPSFVPGKIAGATSDGRPLVGVVCLGRVDESLLVEATARGARSIQLISGPCESCPHRCGGALSDEIIVSAETLLAALGPPPPSTASAFRKPKKRLASPRPRQTLAGTRGALTERVPQMVSKAVYERGWLTLTPSMPARTV